MQSNEINKIFALLYEIKKRLTKIEQNIKNDDQDKQLSNDKTISSDFTRGGSLW